MNCDNCNSLRKAAFDRIIELEDKLAQKQIDVIVAENRKRVAENRTSTVKQCKWEGLTDEERTACLDEADPIEALDNHFAYELMKVVEDRLKEKNNGSL